MDTGREGAEELAESIIEFLMEEGSPQREVLENTGITFTFDTQNVGDQHLRFNQICLVNDQIDAIREGIASGEIQPMGETPEADIRIGVVQEIHDQTEGFSRQATMTTSPEFAQPALELITGHLSEFALRGNTREILSLAYAIAVNIQLWLGVKYGVGAETYDLRVQATLHGFESELEVEFIPREISTGD